MRTKLPRFEPDAKCSACGFDEVGTLHCAKRGLSHYSLCNRVLTYSEEETREHLHRRCDRCGNAWIEDVVGTRSTP